jgi:hypothetical protein
LPILASLSSPSKSPVLVKPGDTAITRQGVLFTSSGFAIVCGDLNFPNFDWSVVVAFISPFNMSGSFFLDFCHPQTIRFLPQLSEF